MTVERKYERDVDLLLAEEFAVNPTFADRFKALTKFDGRNATVADFWVSKSNNLGESDLIVIYQRQDGHRFALLIEDKVDAPLQPDQAARYHQVGDARASYRSAFLETVGTRRVNAWSREVDVVTNEFWDAAYTIAKHEFPLLRLRVTQRGSRPYRPYLPEHDCISFPTCHSPPARLGYVRASDKRFGGDQN